MEHLVPRLRLMRTLVCLLVLLCLGSTIATAAVRKKKPVRKPRSIYQKYRETYASALVVEAQSGNILFQIEHLSIGSMAPEIEATDTSGVSFKLSDYRGKVVLLDFWGNW
jgi:cytochrome oxidase Cu insertion factor (SCO1/SenC/PrrC family)